MIDKNFVKRLVSKALKDGICSHVVGAVISKNSKVLLLERPKDEFFGGIYELPSGNVEENEPLIEALCREVKEETGLEIASVKKYLGYFDYLSKSKKLTRQFNFCVKVKNTSKIILSEHSNYVWVSRKDLDKYPITEEVKKILKKFWKLNKKE